MSYSYVWHDSFVYVTGLLYIRDMSHSYMCAIARYHYEMSHPYVLFLRVTWRIPLAQCGTAGAMWLTFLCVTWLTFIIVTWLTFICVIWLTFIYIEDTFACPDVWHVSHLHVWHDSFHRTVWNGWRVHRWCRRPRHAQLCEQKSPILHPKSPMFHEKSAMSLYSITDADALATYNYVSKRALSFIKRTLCSIKRALYSYIPSPMSTPLPPTIMWAHNDCPVLHQKSPIFHQKSPIFYQKSFISSQTSPPLDRDSPILDEISPIFYQKSPVTYMKRALYSAKRALH